MSKYTNIPSELKNFFSEKRKSSIMDMFSTLLVSLRFDNRSLGGNKRSNCQLTNLQVFQLIVLMPFFAIKGFSHYKNSILNRMSGGRKDVFYSFMAQDHINWRRLIYRMSVTLVSSITCRKDFKKSHLPAVLIADDSDLPKTVFSGIRPSCCAGAMVAPSSCSTFPFMARRVKWKARNRG